MPSSGRAAAVVSASRCWPRPRAVERPCFHLSIPAIDLQRSHDWYVLTLGCQPGRRSDQAAILDFEGHQLVLQSTPRLEELPQVGIYPRHFGLVFATLCRWEQLRDQLVAQGCPFAVTPKCRYAGGPLEHHTLFVQDPSANWLEFKHYSDGEAVLGHADQASVGDQDLR